MGLRKSIHSDLEIRRAVQYVKPPVQLPEISQLRIAMRTLSVVSLLHFLLLNANAQLHTIPLTEDEIVYPYVPPICEEHVWKACVSRWPH
jgi:hypothetical protein